MSQAGAESEPAGLRGLAGATAPSPRALAALLVAFLFAGAATVLLGSLLPVLRPRWRLPHGEAGALFVAQFAAGALGCAAAGWHLRLSVAGGYALAAAGLLALAVLPWPAAVLGAALLGLGVNAAVTATNLVVALGYPGRRAAALSLSNFVWGLGAAGTPLLLSALPAWSLPRVVPAALAVVGLVVAAATALGLERAPQAATSGSVTARPRPARGLGLLAAQLFFYVGSEVALGGWLVTLARESSGFSAAAALRVGSAYWAALLAGRALAPLAMARWGDRRVHVGTLLLAAAGVALLVTGRSPAAVVVGAVLAGAGLAAVFPLLAALVAEHTQAGGSLRRSGWVFACGSLGAAVLPWLVGRIADHAGGVRPALSLVLLVLTWLTVVALRLRRAPATWARPAREA